MNYISVKKDWPQKLNEFKRVVVAFEKDLNVKTPNIGLIGEMEACIELNLKLANDNKNPGYDAVDSDNKRVQIKATRFGKSSGRTSAIYKKDCLQFDYAVLMIYDADFNLLEIWKSEEAQLADYFKRINSPEMQKKRTRKIKRDMSISDFKTCGKKIK
jgi:hypothetical protein